MEEQLKQLQDALASFEVCECEVYSRITGYYRPTFTWNAGKKAEWKERKFYDNAVDRENS